MSSSLSGFQQSMSTTITHEEHGITKGVLLSLALGSAIAAALHFLKPYPVLRILATALLAFAAITALLRAFCVLNQAFSSLP